MFAIATSSAQNKISWERYEDNFTALKKDTLKKGVDKLKYIQLSKNSSVSLGGEIREQFQYYENQNFGDVSTTITNSNAVQIWHRAMVHANVELGSKVRLFAQIGSNFRFANPDPLVAQIDENQLSIHQAFIDYKFHSKWLARVGRQEMYYGNHRLFTFREGPNNRLTFDAAKIVYQSNKRKYDLFIMAPVIAKKGVFDDSSFNEVVIGLHTTEKIITNYLIMDSYTLYYNTDNRSYNYMKGHERRETSGIRLYSSNNTLNYEIEANYQKGKFNDLKIEAYSLNADINYNINTKHNLILGVGANYTSGDKNPSDNKLNTYNSIFSKPPFGLVAPIGLSNIVNINPYIKINPTEKSNIYAGIYWLRRQSNKDGTYSPGAGGAIETRPTPALLYSSVSKDIGTLFLIESNYFINKNISLGLDTSYLTAGNYPKETGTGQDILYISFKSTFKF
ncbi:alginate export family protein [Flavobacterium sp. NG2]|uniref:alginate export family protein n=1 Tax=Flavobacterium sp. NG2 TaxID=3097547 RepID=UPI002A7F807E|nr:alginate export family protein [Flavobacterium sp. NG2]WPR70317.1 alginate export family protein [Flavobacterium sp. NG2]